MDRGAWNASAGGFALPDRCGGGQVRRGDCEGACGEPAYSESLAEAFRRRRPAHKLQPHIPASLQFTRHQTVFGLNGIELAQGSFFFIASSF